MKKIVLAILSICLLAFISCGNTHVTEDYPTVAAYSYKSIEEINDSKGRPHRIVVFSLYSKGLCAIDLDANTYK